MKDVHIFSESKLRFSKINISNVDDKYYACNFGEIFKMENDEMVMLKKYIGKRGYYCVTLYDSRTQKSRTKSIHSLMKNSFFGCNDPNIFINHKDLNKLNNFINNLELSDPLHNTQHAILNGAIPNSVCITEDMIHDIRKLVMNNKYKIKFKDIVDKYKISVSSASRVIRGMVQLKNLENIERYMYLPNNMSYQDMQSEILDVVNRINTGTKVGTIFRIKQHLFSYDTIEKIKKTLDYDTTTKVYGRVFSLI